MTVQYLIDSENVGDFWIPLLDLPAEKSALIVFYTRNSPHMSYESLIRLKESDRTVTFVKCYEGTNALDFQLVSELGYLIGKEEDGSFVIVTNDTGFDAAVKYWRRKKKSVKRITGKECKNLERRLKEDIGENRFSRQRAASMGNPPAEPDASDPSIEKGDGELSGAGRQPAEETEQRSSRPVLRDAESAALPDSDEDSYEEISYGETSYGETSFEETSFEETADDLEEEDSVFDGPSYGDDDQEDNNQGMFDDAAFGSGVADDEPDRVDESRQPEEDQEEKNGEEERTLRGDGSEAEPETDPADEDMTERPEDFPEDHSFAQEEEEGSSEEFLSPDHQGHERIVPGVTIPESESYSSTASAEGSLTGEAVVQPLEETPGLPFSATKDSDKQKTSDQDRTEETASSEKNSSEGNSSEGNSSRGSTSERNPSGTEFSETEASGAENGEKDDQGLSPESGHRSKSRRSRTRRSRSASRKTEQPAEEDQVRDDDEKQRTIPSDQEGTSGGQSQPVKAKADSLPDDEEIARIVACIGPENLAELHNQLATFYGDQGKDIYLSIKSNSRNLPVLKPDLGQKFAYYCEIIFARSDYSGEYPADISEFLLNAREKLGNLNSLRYALIKQYGKEKGRRFYFLLKPFAKTMYQM